MVDNFDDIDGKEFGYFLNLGIANNLMTEFEGEIDNFRVDRLYNGEGLRKQQEEEGVLYI